MKECHLKDDSETSTLAGRQNPSAVRTLFDLFDATTHLCMRSYLSVHPSVRLSVGQSPVIFKRLKTSLPCSDDDEIRQGPRESQGQFTNDIRMLVRRSVCPSDAKKEEREKKSKKERKKNRKKKRKKENERKKERKKEG